MSHPGRLFSFLCVCAVFWCASASFAADWPDLAYTEVRAYSWDPDSKAPHGIRDDKSPEPESLNPQGALLTAAQVQRLITAIGTKIPPHAIAGCYDPHHAFVFYDAAHQPVVFVEWRAPC